MTCPDPDPTPPTDPIPDPEPDPGTTPMPEGDQEYDGEVCPSCQHTAERCAECGGALGYWPWKPCKRCRRNLGLV